MLGLPRVDRYGGGGRHSRGERYHPYHHSSHVPYLPHRPADESEEVTLHTLRSHHDQSTFDVQLDYPQYGQGSFDYHQVNFDPGQQYEHSNYHSFPGEEPLEHKPSIHTMASEDGQTTQVLDESNDQRIHHPPPKERRFKLSRACDRCRRRRIKCDEGHPCQSCLTADSACTFEEPGKRTQSNKAKRAASIEDRMNHLEKLIQSIPFSLFSQGASAVPASDAPMSSPHASFASATHSFPLSVPPPSLMQFPIMNPSTHFPLSQESMQPSTAPTEGIQRSMSNMLSASYLYLDDEGYTRWQGESSGLPLLDFLVERKLPAASSNPPTDDDNQSNPARESWSRKPESVTTGTWFPNRRTRVTGSIPPELMWRTITAVIPPPLMDSLIQCFLSTSHYLIPFLHVPQFLNDYGNPQKWGEPGFAAFIVAICCLSSRHVDDPRVRADPSDGFSAGTHWFDLFCKLRTMPATDRPTLYAVQSVFVAAVYAIGLGRLSRGFALLAEACTLSMDAGLHRSSDNYDCFGPIEEQVRRRTFWCVYMWDKQAAAAFGRPPLLRLRDCDAREPAVVDDEYITSESVGTQPEGSESRLGAFVACTRLSVVLESVLESPTTVAVSTDPFLQRASTLFTNAYADNRFLHAEEQLLDTVIQTLHPFWAHTAETMGSPDVLRVTQCERLHCFSLFVRMLIARKRFSLFVGERIRRLDNDGSDAGSSPAVSESIEQSEEERSAMMKCHESAVELIQSHTQVAKKGLMTYYGVHVIHQLTQAGRSLIAVLLNCITSDLQPLVPPSLEALRSCVVLLRRFSGRYVCGMRSGDLIEEFCRLTRIPLDTPSPQAQMDPLEDPSRPAWIRPVRKKSVAANGRSVSGEPEGSRHGSPADDATTPGMLSPISPQLALRTTSFPSASPAPAQSLNGSFDFMQMQGSASTPTSAFTSGFGSMEGSTNFNGLDGQGMSVDGIDLNTANGPTAFMSLLNDGSFDMNALFNPGDFGFAGASMIPASSPIVRSASSARGEGPSVGIAVSP